MHTLERYKYFFQSGQKGIQVCVIFSSQGKKWRVRCSLKNIHLFLSVLTHTHTHAHTPIPIIPNFHRSFLLAVNIPVSYRGNNDTQDAEKDRMTWCRKTIQSKNNSMLGLYTSCKSFALLPKISNILAVDMIA